MDGAGGGWGSGGSRYSISHLQHQLTSSTSTSACRPPGSTRWQPAQTSSPPSPPGAALAPLARGSWPGAPCCRERRHRCVSSPLLRPWLPLILIWCLVQVPGHLPQGYEPWHPPPPQGRGGSQLVFDTIQYNKLTILNWCLVQVPGQLPQDYQPWRPPPPPAAPAPALASAAPDGPPEEAMASMYLNARTPVVQVSCRREGGA